MISLGIVDVILIVLLVLAIYLASKRRQLALSILVAVLLVAVMTERLAPGTLSSVGSAIHGIDRVNDAGPHMTIQPIVRFEK